MNKLAFALLLTSTLFITGCATVQPWQKMYINDEEMELKDNKLSTFENSFHTYREGASGADGGAAGGGCGCN